MKDKINVVIVDAPLDDQKSYQTLYKKVGLDEDNTFSLLCNKNSMLMIDMAVDENYINQIYIHGRCKIKSNAQNWKDQGVKISRLW